MVEKENSKVNGKKLYALYNKLYVYDIETLNLLETISVNVKDKNHLRKIDMIIMNNQVIISYQEDYIQSFDLENKKLIKSQKFPIFNDADIRMCTLKGDLFAAAGIEAICIFDSNLKEINSFEATGHFLKHYEHNNESHLLAGNLRGTAFLWNYNEGKLLKKFSLYDYFGTFLDLGNNSFCMSKQKCKIAIIDSEKNEIINELSNTDSHTGTVRGMIKIDDDLIASCSEDMSIKLWNLKEFKCVNTFLIPKPNKYTPDNHLIPRYIVHYKNDKTNIIVSGHFGGLLYFWDVNSNSTELKMKKLINVSTDEWIIGLIIH